ncbi:MAG: hypothetical protein MPJ22_01570, partial [Pirellulales bacterium]|nr:hypothetical protein [Pirellulales bacterium]
MENRSYAEMGWLAHWLTRHLDNLDLIVWLVNRGGSLHENFAWLISHQLKNSDVDLDPFTRTLWELFIAGRVDTHNRDRSTNPFWSERFVRDGLTESLRIALRDMLTPWVSIQRYPPLSERHEVTGEGFVRYDYDVVCDTRVMVYIEQLSGVQKWKEAQPKLLGDFDSLLREVFDLKRDLNLVSEEDDLSYRARPAIQEHSQNDHKHDAYPWTILIDLVRDAWTETASVDSERALRFAKDWWRAPYPLFKRLALFAATHESVVPPRLALDWLFEDNCYWMWSGKCRYEKFQLLSSLAPRLSSSELNELEEKILDDLSQGPRREEISEEMWRVATNHDIWLHLALLDKGGASLGVDARNKLDDLQRKNPDWSVDEESMQFLFYTSAARYDWSEPDADRSESDEPSIPRLRRELVDWIRQNPGYAPSASDAWKQYCHGNFATAACALFHLTREGNWPRDRWSAALEAWSEQAKLAMLSWRHLKPVLLQAPDGFLISIDLAVADWLFSDKANMDGQEEKILTVFNHLLDSWSQSPSRALMTDDAYMNAINDPAARLTERILPWRFKEHPEKGKGLPEDIKPIFTKICDTRNAGLRHARTVLAPRLTFLLHIDEDWTKKYMLPLFEWENPEAANMWQGFLRTQTRRSVIKALKQPLLNAAKRENYERLGEAKAMYAQWLTLAALEGGNIIERRELAEAVDLLPEDGLCESVDMVTHALKRQKDEQRRAYWTDRIAPYLREVWPQSREKAMSKISDRFYYLCIEAGDAFGDAWQQLRPWLQSTQHYYVILHMFADTDICEKFPEESLEFLHVLANKDDLVALPRDLKGCLEKIKEKRPALEQNYKFEDLARRAGM